jgi:SAM-dependent methyltransferase
MRNPFDRSGLASLDDLSTPAWQRIFRYLESVQEEFLAAQPHTSDYPWPRDPLHNFIRVWEYPFVYHHLQSQFSLNPDGSKPAAVDQGSGATFFPFAVARLGWNVVAVDADTRTISSLERACKALPAGPGAVTSLLSDARSITLEDASVDCVYCISVLEHIPDFENVISEVHRILRPSGLFLLTVDIDLNGNFELRPDAYTQLNDCLDRSFTPLHLESVTYPTRLLTSDNSIYSLSNTRSPFKSCSLHFELSRTDFRPPHYSYRPMEPVSALYRMRTSLVLTRY